MSRRSPTAVPDRRAHGDARLVRALVVAAFVVLGPVEAAVRVWGAPATGRSASWGASVAAALLLTLSSLVPLGAAVWLAPRSPARGRRWARRLGLHASAAVLVSLVAAAGRGGAGALVPWVGGAFTFEAFAQQLPNYILFASFAQAAAFVRRAGRARAAQQRLGRSLARAGREQAAAELRAVKAELHPALVARTLESARALVRSDPATAERLVVQLGAFMRDAVRNARLEEVTLAEEIDAVCARGGWAGRREGGGGDAASAVTFDVDEEAGALYVPHLIVPTLLTCAEEAGWLGGRLTLRARTDSGDADPDGGDRLVLALWPAAPDADLPSQSRAGAALDATSGVTPSATSTVASLRRQLAHLYGADVELALRLPSDPGVGPAVRLTLPARGDDAPEHARTRADGRELEAWMADVAGARAPVRGVGTDGWLVGGLGALLAALVWWGMADQPGRQWTAGPVVFIGLVVVATFGTIAMAAVATTRRWPVGVEAQPGLALRAHAAVGLTMALTWTVLRALAEGVARGTAFGAGHARPPAYVVFHALALVAMYAVFASVAHVLVLGRERRHSARLSRELRAARTARERGRAHSELRALKAELNPHFVGNALHTAAALVRQDPDAAARVLGALGALAGAADARVATQEVSLAAEVVGLEPFVILEQAQLGASGGRLSVKWDISPGALDAAVPHLILQPLVENAVRHGLAPRGGAGRLVITAGRVGTRLELRVEDDGVGPGAGGAAEVPADRASVTGGVGGGAGLGGVRRRLALLYGAGATCALEPAPGGGAVARLTLPYRPMPTTCETAGVAVAAGG